MLVKAETSQTNEKKGKIKNEKVTKLEIKYAKKKQNNKARIY